MGAGAIELRSMPTHAVKLHEWGHPVPWQVEKQILRLRRRMTRVGAGARTGIGAGALCELDGSADEQDHRGWADLGSAKFGQGD